MNEHVMFANGLSQALVEIVAALAVTFVVIELGDRLVQRIKKWHSTPNNLA